MGFTLYAPILIGDAVDFIVGKGQVDFGKILQILVKLAVIIGVTSVAQWLMNLCNNQITYRVVKDVRMNAFEHLQKLPLKYVEQSPIRRDDQQNHHRCRAIFRWTFDGIFTAVYRVL